MRPSLFTSIVVAVLITASVPAWAVDPDTEIIITGGGWGHGIGMPQYGARGMADDGAGYDEILSHFYIGTGLGSATGSSPTVPNLLRIGEKRMHKAIAFRPVAGDLEGCLAGESSGSCSFALTADTDHTLQWTGGSCHLFAGAGALGEVPGCYLTLEWSNQPATRVDFPNLDRTFARGRVVFSGDDVDSNSVVDGFFVTVEVSLEEYVLGIGEVPQSWPAEALKAQAVAARTYGADRAGSRAAIPAFASNGGLMPTCDCHLQWTTSDQVYYGWTDRTEGNATVGWRWADAVTETAGTVVVYPAGSTSLAETYYFSNSGGRTENVSDIWGSNQAAYPYLASVDDPWSGRYANPDCTASLVRWCRTRTAGQIASALQVDLVTQIQIVDRFASGSPSDIVVTALDDGQTVEINLTGVQFKSKLGLVSHHIYDVIGFRQATRLAGPNRYATAAAVSQWAHPNGAEVVYVATGLNHPDALAGGAAAAHEGAPLLLVQYEAVPTSTLAELARLKPSKIVLLGGTAAISDAVADQLEQIAPVERRSGRTRYETAVAVSRAAFEFSDRVYVATGENFPDAVVAAPAAASANAPLLLVPKSSVPAVVLAEIERLGAGEIVVIGGSAVIADSVLDLLETGGRSVSRVAGANRYSGSVELARHAFSDGAPTVYVAVGTNYPDALAGGAASASVPGPILLVGTDEIPAIVQAELNRLAPTEIVVLGGEAVVSASVASQLTGYIR